MNSGSFFRMKDGTFTVFCKACCKIYCIGLIIEATLFFISSTSLHAFVIQCSDYVLGVCFQAVPTSKGQALADEYGIKFFETVSIAC